MPLCRTPCMPAAARHTHVDRFGTCYDFKVKPTRGRGRESGAGVERKESPRSIAAVAVKPRGEARQHERRKTAGATAGRVQGTGEAAAGLSIKQITRWQYTWVGSVRLFPCFFVWCAVGAAIRPPGSCHPPSPGMHQSAVQQGSRPQHPSLVVASGGDGVGGAKGGVPHCGQAKEGGWGSAGYGSVGQGDAEEALPAGPCHAPLSVQPTAHAQTSAHPPTRVAHPPVWNQPSLPSVRS